MSDTVTLETVAADIKERLDTIHADVTERTSDEALLARIKALMPDLLADDADFARKLRWAAPAPAGTKFARYGLTAGEVEMVHSIMTSGQRLGLGPGPSEELENAFKEVTSGRYFTPAEAYQADKADLERMQRAGQFGTGRAADDAFSRALEAAAHGRAMDTAESGYGAELIGAQYSSELWQGARAQSRVSALIPTFPMTDPTAYLPVEAAPPEMLFVSESTTNNASNYATSKTGSNRVQVDAKKFVIHQMWSGEMEEDSIVAYIPFLRGQAARSLAHYGDSLVLNGDTTNAATGNINLDDADPADTKHYLAFDGIRHAALVDNTGNATDHSGAAVTLVSLLNLKSLCIDSTYLHDWGHPVDPTDFVYVVDPQGADYISQISELLTVDKYGDRATVLNGEVGRIGQHPLIASMAVSKTEADGKVSTTGGNNVFNQAVAFNRRGYALGVRRQLKVEAERLPATDQARVVYSQRLGFGRFTPTGAAAGIESAAVLYDWDNAT